MLTILFSFFLALHAKAVGPSTSGGGVGVICKVGESVTVEILDLFEAKMSRLSLVKSSGLVDQDYIVGLQRVRALLGDPRPVNSDDLDNARKTIASVTNFTRDPIPLTSDIGKTIPLPTNCQYVQIAVYKDQTNSLLVNEELWQQLDSLNKAALMMHETIYKIQRVAFYTSSEQARYLVRQLFSENGPEFNGPYDGIQKGKALICNAGDPGKGSDITFLWQGRQITLLMLAGEVRLAKTTIDIPVSIDDMQLRTEPIDQNATGVRIISTPQNFSIKNQSFTSALPVPHITWKQEVLKGQFLRVGVNIRGANMMVNVRSCAVLR